VPVLSVRTATPQDAEAVAGVQVRSWQVGYRGLLPDDYLDGLDPDDRRARYTFGITGADQPSTVVAVEDGVICGFATTGPSRDADVPDAGELLALYVDPRAWGRGVGRRLVVDARERLYRSGYTEAVLWVLAGNDRAQRFYRLDGWRPDDRRQHQEVWGVTVDEVGFRRALP